MLRMLIVDDDFAHCQGIGQLSKQFSEELDTVLCDDPQRALELLRTQRFHILFIDIRMPILSGLDVIEQILPERPDLQVIVYTAHSEFTYTKRAMSLGVRHYILKPIRITEFQQELMAVISECRAQEVRRFREFVSKTYYGTYTVEAQMESCFPCQIVLVDFEQSVLSESNAEEELQQLLGNDLKIVLLNDCQLVAAGQEVDTHRLSSLLCSWRPVGYVMVDGGRLVSAAQLASALKNMTDLLSFRFYMENGHTYRLDDDFLSDRSGADKAEGLATAAELANCRKFEEAERNVVRFFTEIQRNGHDSDLYIKYLTANFLKQFWTAEDKGTESPDCLIKQVFSSKNIDTLCHLCCETLHRARQEHSEGSGRLVIDQAIEILEEECDKSLSLSQLAERVYLSPSHLSYLFKKYTGETFIKFFTELRMRKAKELLLQTTWKVGEIGRRVGYANTSYFCNLFRDVYGLSPSQYRETQIR